MALDGRVSKRTGSRINKNTDVAKIMRRRLILIGIMFSALGWQPIAAQETDPMSEGMLAFRAANYQEAAAAFEQASKDNPQNAEALFLLARVYFETPLRDTKKAGKLLDRALKIEPDNVKYLVARLEQLRVDSKNFIIDKIREEKRRKLAGRILRLDSTNAFAHEEFGKAYIRDFWRFRNAFMFPTFAFRQFNGVDPYDTDPLLGYQSEIVSFDPTSGGRTLDVVDPGKEPLGQVSSPNLAFPADEFDIETLKQQGVPVQDLSRRALRAYSLAIRHLKAALKSDPRKRTIYDDMMRIFVLKGEYDDALQMLQQMYVYFPDDAGLWSYLGLAHYRSGNLDASSKAFETALKFMTPDEKEAFEDLSIILPKKEEAKYDSDKVSYASRFWTSEDPMYLTTANERRLEHYSRLVYADLLYGAPKLKLRGWDTKRGQILVRYGVPKTDVIIMPHSTRSVQTGLNPIGGNAPDPNAFATADPTLSAFSSNPRQLGNFKSKMDDFEEANTYNVWDYGDFRFVFEDPFRNGEFRLYSPSAKSIAGGSIPHFNDYAIRAKEIFRSTPERFDYESPGRQIELPYLVASFKGKNNLTDVYVNYGIPVQHYDPNAEMIDITAKAGIFLISEDREMLFERRRTVYGLRTDQIFDFEDTNIWIDTQEMQSPPGNQEISVEFETASGGTSAVQRRKVTVPTYADGDVALSDLMLAYRIEEAVDKTATEHADIVRDGLSIQPAPWSVFSHKQPIYFFFEIYNLKKNPDGKTDYEIEAVLSPKEKGKGIGKFVKGIFGGGKKGVSIRLPGNGTSRDEGQYLILDASKQKTGLYTLHMKVKDLISGKDVQSRTQDLYLE